MIRHMIFWNLSPAVTNVLSVVTDLRSGFQEMADKIDGFRAVSFDCDLGFGTHDVALYCEFDSWNSLKNYQTHPLYTAFRARTQHLLTDLVCVDLEV